MYVIERVTKLLVPLLVGMVLICPVLAYYGLKTHGYPTVCFEDAYLHFFGSFNNIHNSAGFSGDFSYGHLWFIWYLFIISIVALMLILLGKKQTIIHVNPDAISLPALVLLFIPVWLLNFVGAVLSGYSLISYLFIFFIGYYLVSLDQVQERLKKNWMLLLISWIVSTDVLAIVIGDFFRASLSPCNDASPYFFV